jgi:hypothetical protein
MNTPSVSPSGPSFLAWVGPHERTLWRVGAWVALSVVFAILGGTVIAALFAFADPNATAVAEAAQSAPLSGPERLYRESEFTALLALSLAAVAVSFLAAARLVFGRPAWTFVSPVRPFSFKYLGLGFAVYGGLLAIGLGAQLLLGQEIDPPVLDTRYGLDQRLTYAFASALFLLLAAAAEELMCRGVILQVTGAFTRRTVVLAAANGLIFAAMHFDFEPAAFASRALLGAVWAYAALELAGVEFGIGAHFANNLLLVLLVEPISSASQLGRPYPLADLVQDLGTSLLMLAAVWAIGRLRRAR